MVRPESNSRLPAGQPETRPTEPPVRYLREKGRKLYLTSRSSAAANSGHCKLKLTILTQIKTNSAFCV